MKLTRQEVYELVWSAPMTAIARLLGISSGSLGKTCERRGIPTPERGYWQKVAAGHDVPPRPPLREVEFELPMPWDRTPVIETALARLMPKATPEAQTSSPEAASEGSKQESSIQSEQSGNGVLSLYQPASVQAANEGGSNCMHRLPLDIEAAIALSRRLDDLRALKLLTELVLQASTALPALEEDRIRDWVVHIRSGMRNLDPVRHLTETARTVPTSAHEMKPGQT